MFVFPDTFVPPNTLWSTSPDSSLTLLTIGAGLVLFLLALVVLAQRRTRRTTIDCPAHGRRAHVTLHLVDGTPTDVLDCDLADGTTGATGCQRACLPGRR